MEENMKTTKKITWVILSIVLLIPLFLTMSSAFANNPKSTSDPKEITPIDQYKDILKSYEDELKSDKTSKEEKDLVKRKYESMASEATQWAEAVKKDKSRPYETLTITQTPAPIIYRKAPDGVDAHPIIPDRNVFPKDIFPVNGWHKEIGNVGTLFVYAGYVTNTPSQGIDNPSQGIVYLKEAGKTLKFKKFLAPANSGKLHIVSEDKMVLTLQNETGQTFYFDVKKESFVDQDGNEIPGDNNIVSTPTVPVGYPAP
jgi:hypothetical protein